MLQMEMLWNARSVLSGVINKTPLIPAGTVGEGGSLFLKAECLQKTGAFKLRGAYYKIATLTEEEKRRGVIACSAGNHAQGVAFAARDMGIHAVICIPEGAPLSKIEATRSYGAEVVIVSLCWGRTSATAATNDQRAQAQQIADAGADVILGTNPQAVFPVEILTAQRGDGKYHPVLCAYSMGNLFTFDRESRNNLAGILLRADVQYDPSTKTIAFDNLTYDPTFCWRDSIEGVTRTGIVPADPNSPPVFLGKKQIDVMERCYNQIVKLMKDSVLKEQ